MLLINQGSLSLSAILKSTSKFLYSAIAEECQRERRDRSRKASDSGIVLVLPKLKGDPLPAPPSQLGYVDL